MSQFRIIKFIKSNWGIFSFFFIVAALLAVKYNYYSAKKFNATAGIASSNPIPENSARLFSWASFSETNISPALIESISAASGNSNVEYSIVKSFHNQELFNDCPITVQYKLKNTQFAKQTFTFTHAGDDNFNLTFNYRDITRSRTGKFGIPIHEADLVLTVDKNISDIQFKPEELLSNTIEFTVFSNHEYAAHLLENNIDIKTSNGITSVNGISSNPAKAASIANETAQILIDGRAADKTVQIDNELSKTAKQLDQAQAAIVDYKTKNNIGNAAGETNAHSSTVQNLEATKLDLLLQARSLDNLSDYMRQNRTGGNAAPEFGTINDPLFAGYLTKLNEKNFERQNANATESTRIDGEINYLKNIIAEGIRNTRKKIALQTEEINKQFASLGQTGTNVFVKDSQLQTLERNKQLIENHYNYLSGKRSELLFASGDTHNNASLYQASLPTAPLNLPNTTTWIFALCAALFTSILVSVIKTIFFKPNEITTKTNNHNFITKLKTKGETDSQEQFKELCTQLLLLNDSQSKQVISITASNKSTGKRIVAERLAKTFALYDTKVLLLDMDTNYEMNESVFEFTPTHTLADVIESKTNLMEAINISSIPNLDLLTGGTFKEGINSLLISNKIQKIIDNLKQQYDYIIINTPLISSPYEAAPLIRLSTTSLGVIKDGFKIQSQLDSVSRFAADFTVSNFKLVLDNISSKETANTKWLTTGENDENATTTIKQEPLPFLKRVALWFY